MDVRTILPQDHESFIELCKEFYSTKATHRDYNEALAEKTFNYLIARHENLWGYLILGDSGNVVGYALITSYWCNEDGGNVIVLDELFIRQEYRHHGYGALFMRFLENEFKDKAVSITLEVVTTNTIAKSLYSRQGYMKDGFEVLTKAL